MTADSVIAHKALQAPQSRVVLLQRFAHLDKMPFIMKLRAWAQVSSYSPQSSCAPKEAYF